ncbi:hypothetical protein LUZ63_008167 [Rhynchospora breviuscula]|uniref:Uncharacterized protein n=1 Tax=Rhynchospora breviuscula TaxID=2022672 RepID=A0A9Q0CT28_9POAL|nr:hypothetical protein LUZ63_008167 [Rhynchospora breviuscula]
MISQTQFHRQPNQHHHRSRDKEALTKKTMKDLTSCFSNHAVRVADVACSRSSTVVNRYTFATPNNQPNRSTVTSTYITRLTSQQEILIRFSWSRNHEGSCLTIKLDDQFYNNSPKRMSSRTMSIQLSQEKKGNWTFTWSSYTVNLYWDMTAAVYSKSPEPISGFNVFMYINSESVLLLGEVTKGCLNQVDLIGTAPLAQTVMISRKEQVHGLTSYTTKARFHPADSDHKICINYEADKKRFSVNVDEKLAVYATKLNWNFRGSQTIFFEKTMVDFMWNLHGWLHGEDSSRDPECAWFMFRARSSLDEWLWQVEDGTTHSSFIFTIEAFKGRD